MILIAIDPGTEQSGVVVVSADGTIQGHVHENRLLVSALRGNGGGIVGPAHLVIEEVESYGMAVGREVFETCVWTGRFIEAWQSRGIEATWSLLPRRKVKLEICGSAKAKDANIRAALIDKYGGKEKAIGSKKAPGPLYGIRSHLWSALALAETYREQQEAC